MGGLHTSSITVTTQLSEMRSPGLALHLWNQNLHFNKVIRRHVDTFKFEKHGIAQWTGSESGELAQISEPAPYQLTNCLASLYLHLLIGWVEPISILSLISSLCFSLFLVFLCSWFFHVSDMLAFSTHLFFLDTFAKEERIDMQIQHASFYCTLFY